MEESYSNFLNEPFFIILQFFSPASLAGLLLCSLLNEFLSCELSSPASNLLPALSAGLAWLCLCVFPLPPFVPGDPWWPLSDGGRIASRGCLLPPFEFLFIPIYDKHWEALFATGRKVQNPHTHTYTLAHREARSIVVCISPLENSLFSSVQTLQSIDSQILVGCWFWLCLWRQWARAVTVFFFTTSSANM